MTLPELPESFAWRQTPRGPVLECVPLAAVAPHAFTTRHIPVRTDDDWSWLAELTGGRQAVTLTQVHGRAVVEVRRGVKARNSRPEADVLVSDDPEVAIAVRAADCVPLVIADSRSGAVAAVHAGWRGTAAGAARAAVETLTERFGASPSTLIAAVGPSIGPCCYEVGSELVDAFAAAGHPRHLVDRWFSRPRRELDALKRQGAKLVLDVPGANRDQLMLAGVPEDQIFLSGVCTAEHLDVLTSYRAEKDRAGRLVAVIRSSGR